MNCSPKVGLINSVPYFRGVFHVSKQSFGHRAVAGWRRPRNVGEVTVANANELEIHDEFGGLVVGRFTTDVGHFVPQVSGTGVVGAFHGAFDDFAVVMQCGGDAGGWRSCGSRPGRTRVLCPRRGRRGPSGRRWRPNLLVPPCVGGGWTRQGGNELALRDVQSMAPAIILVPTPEPDYPTQSIVDLMLKRSWTCACQGSMETPPAAFRLPNTSVITRNFVRNFQGKRDGFVMVISKIDPKNTFVLRNGS